MFKQDLEQISRFTRGCRYTASTVRFKKLSTRDALENSAAKQGGGKEKPDGHLGVVEIKIGFNT